MATFTTTDGTSIHYKDWGGGPAVVLSHGQPLNADSWEEQALFLAEHGYRVVAHGRRGFGRSSQPRGGYDYDRFADVLAALIAALDLHDIALFGFSMGGGEVARYGGRHGTARIAKLDLVAAVPPLMLRTDANPGGTPLSVFDGIRAGVRAVSAQFFADVSKPFFGANRPGAKVSQAMLDWFWLMGMQASIKGTLDCIKAFPKTDCTAELTKFDRPTLVIHDDDDQIVPIGGIRRGRGEAYSGRTARTDRDAQGHGQRRPAGVSAPLTAGTLLCCQRRRMRCPSRKPFRAVCC
jgi:non-heme chloroperoxidase